MFKEFRRLSWNHLELVTQATAQDLVPLSELEFKCLEGGPELCVYVLSDAEDPKLYKV